MPKAQPKGVPQLPMGRIVLALSLVPGVYATMAFAALLSLGIGGGSVYGIYWVFTNLHRVNARAVLFGAAIAIGALVAAYAIMRGVIATFRRPHAFEPGLLIRPSDDPELADTIKGVCAKIGCPPPTAILLSPGPEFSAQQSKIQALNGQAEGSILTVGLPLLDALTVDEFRAVAAHEMAHFTGRDTIYTVRVLPVYVGIGTSLESLGGFGEATEGSGGCYGCAFQLPMLVPALILRAYLGLFSALDSSIRRVRESRADYLAARAAGSEAFRSALRNVVRAGGYFEEYLERQAKAPPRPEERTINYFADFRRALSEATLRLDALESEAMEQTEEALAHHPPLSARLDSLPDFPGDEPDTRRAAELLTDAAKYEEALNGVLRVVAGDTTTLRVSLPGAMNQPPEPE